MQRLARFLVFMCSPGLLVGCTLNDVRPLPTGSPVIEGRAVVVYGVGVEHQGAWPRFAVELEEYSVKRKSATGNCFRFNRTEATVPSTPGPVKYFAFEVPPGHYVYGAFNAAPLGHDPQAFDAPEGRMVYVGDFIYTRQQTVVVRRDLDTLKKALGTSLPDLQGEVFLAEAVAAERPKMFLCSP